jgi:phosphatidylinositol kinase/protein kinase (PI-3  family)
VLKNYLNLFIRDDLLSWNSTKVPVLSDHAQRQLEKVLRENILRNAQLVLKRMHVLMPNSLPDKSAAVVVNHKVLHLVKLATSKRKLCMMNPTWAPWF